MKATIWAPDFVMPTGFCFNCGGPPATHLEVFNEAGLGTTEARGLIGLAATVAREAVASNGGWMVPYCAPCAAQARACVWEDLPAFLLRWKLRPGQTIIGRAFRILNGGKDLLRGNKWFLKVQASNPRVIAEIKSLNPGIRIT